MKLFAFKVLFESDYPATLLLMSKNSYFLIVTDYLMTGRSPRQKSLPSLVDTTAARDYGDFTVVL
jgi:hypothetical protein